MEGHNQRYKPQTVDWYDDVEHHGAKPTRCKSKPKFEPKLARIVGSWLHGDGDGDGDGDADCDNGNGNDNDNGNGKVTGEKVMKVMSKKLPELQHPKFEFYTMPKNLA